jgi:hypothetical protein
VTSGLSAGRLVHEKPSQLDVAPVVVKANAVRAGALCDGAIVGEEAGLDETTGPEVPDKTMREPTTAAMTAMPASAAIPAGKRVATADPLGEWEGRRALSATASHSLRKSSLLLLIMLSPVSRGRGSPPL